MMKHPSPRRGRQAAVPALSENTRLALYGALATATVAFLLYLRTLTPGLHFGDGPELAAAAHVLGVPHPTGYPLYMLLTKIWLLLTGSGDVILRTTLFSTLCAAASAGLWNLIAFDAFRKVLPQQQLKPLLILSGGAGLTVGLLLSVWNSATVTEVYALQFLIMSAFVRVVQLAERSPTARRELVMASALLAAGIAHHRLSIVLILPYLSLWWRCIRNGKATNGATKPPWVAATVILLVGLSFYFYLPIRASTSPAINWGNTVKINNLLHHIRGTEYLNRSLLRPGQEKSFSSVESQDFIGLHTQHLLSDFANQGIALSLKPTPAMQWNRVFWVAGGLGALAALTLAGGAAMGAWKWFSFSRLTAGTVILIGLQNVIITYAYNIADISDYCIFPWAAAWFLLYVGAFHLLGRIAPDRLLLMSYAGPAFALLIALGNLGRTDRSSDTGAEIMASVILPVEKDLMPEGSVLLTGADADTFVAWYQKVARQVRPDVLVFAGNFIWKSWYNAFFTPGQIRDYHLKFASAVARNPQEYVDQLRHGILDANVGKRPVFTSISDPHVLHGLTGYFTLQPVAAAFVPSAIDLDGTTVTLIKISPKGT